MFFSIKIAPSPYPRLVRVPDVHGSICKIEKRTCYLLWCCHHNTGQTGLHCETSVHVQMWPGTSGSPPFQRNVNMFPGNKLLLNCKARQPYCYGIIQTLSLQTQIDIRKTLNFKNVKENKKQQLHNIKQTTTQETNIERNRMEKTIKKQVKSLNLME